MIIGFAKLDIEIPFIDKDILCINSNWLPHYNTNGYEGDWSVQTLRSPDGSTDNIFAELIGADKYQDTPLLNRYPAIKQICDNLQCELMSVRLLNLKAGAVIKQHRDNELAFEKGEARLHFPIVTNSSVEFYVNDIRLTMLPGECWYINANLPHHVANYGSTDRIHLVIDCKVNDWLSDIFAKAERTEFDEPFDAEQSFSVIAELRNQKNETANKLADELQLELNKRLFNTPNG
jgi:mannose-6-phosphate isomerase-like protein (cupin superfamily)